MGGGPFNDNRKKVKHHDRLSIPPKKMRNGVCLKNLLTFLRETKWPRIAEKILSQCAPPGEMLASLYRDVLETLLRIWTALPQLIP